MYFWGRCQGPEKLGSRNTRDRVWNVVSSEKPCDETSFGKKDKKSGTTTSMKLRTAWSYEKDKKAEQHVPQSAELKRQKATRASNLELIYNHFALRTFRAGDSFCTLVRAKGFCSFSAVQRLIENQWANKFNMMTTNWLTCLENQKTRALHCRRPKSCTCRTWSNLHLHQSETQ